MPSNARLPFPRGSGASACCFESRFYNGLKQALGRPLALKSDEASLQIAVGPASQSRVRDMHRTCDYSARGLTPKMYAASVASPSIAKPMAITLIINDSPASRQVHFSYLQLSRQVQQTKKTFPLAVLFIFIELSDAWPQGLLSRRVAPTECRLGGRDGCAHKQRKRGDGYDTDLALHISHGDPLEMSQFRSQTPRRQPPWKGGHYGEYAV